MRLFELVSEISPSVLWKLLLLDLIAKIEKFQDEAAYITSGDSFQFFAMYLSSQNRTIRRIHNVLVLDPSLHTEFGEYRLVFAATRVTKQYKIKTTILAKFFVLIS